jgi:hypothetical protein
VRTAGGATAGTVTLDPPGDVMPGAAPDVAAEGTPDVTAGGPALPTRASAARRPRTASRARPPRHRLLLACTAVLAAGLFGVLLLNTIISQGAFRQHELEIDLILLAEREEALARAVQLAESPIEVEKRARKLGMVPAAAPVFLRLDDGAILGEPVPAPEPTGKVDFAGAPGIQPTPKPTPTPTASPATGIDPGLDPSTGIDPALDPSTGIDPAPDPTAGVAPTAGDPPEGVDQAPVATPSPTPTQQGVTP